MWKGKSKNGKDIVLLNPAEKGKRYAEQLKAGKVIETGKPLDEGDRKWQRGYLKSRSDNAAAYNANMKKTRLPNKGFNIKLDSFISEADAAQKKGTPKKGQQKRFDWGVRVDRNGEPYVKRPNGRPDYDSYSVIMANQLQTLYDIGEYDIDKNLRF